MQIQTVKAADADVFLRTHQGGSQKLHLWFVHGFGDSGFSFIESFNSPALKNYSIFVPDFPGFGASPPPAAPHDINQSSLLLCDLIKKFSTEALVVLIGHSLGGLIVTKTALNMKEKIQCLINVEGNLTKADTFYSGKAAKASDPILWKKEFMEQIYEASLKEEAIRRYYVSLKMASPHSLHTWGKSGVIETGEELGGENLLRVSCPNLYIFAEKSMSELSKSFIMKHKIRFLEFASSGHWPMLDETGKFYQAVADFIESCRPFALSSIIAGG